MLAKELCASLSETYNILYRLPAQIIEEYKNNLYKLNETVRLKKGSRVFDASIKNVTQLGELIVEHATEERFSVGEVEWV